jgi:hypothetical protein
MPMPDTLAPCPQPSASDLLEAFDNLNHSLATFCTLLRQGDRALWVPRRDSESSISARDFASSLIADIWYQDGQDGRCTRSRHGLVGADETLLASAQLLNQHKAAFQQAAKCLNTQQLRELPVQLAHRSALLGELLNRQGLGRIHLKQCYRQIPILERTPSRIGFNWYCSGRSIRRLTASDAMALLLKLDQSQPHVQVQLARLAPLNANTPLAQLQTQVPVMRANIAWKKDTGWLRQARNCPLPLLFPLAPGAPLPQHNRPDLEPPSGRQRAERSDARIDPEPFIPSLRIHCYQN